MLYATQSSLRGRIWKLPNGYWRGCNLAGSQCTFRLHNEALNFAQKKLLVTELGQVDQNAARKYVKSIKNAAKRQYAETYLLYRLGHVGTEPERPEELSYMAAQAVRLELNSILK